MNENEKYSLAQAQALLEQAKKIALEADDKYQEVMTLVDKIISFLDKDNQ